MNGLVSTVLAASPAVDRITSQRLLKQWIDQADGFLPLEAFMRKALYDSEHGYYTTHIQGVGPDGDFSTSATLSKLLGRGISQWAVNALGRGHRTTRFRWNLIEIGGGSGTLAEAVLQNIPLIQRLGCRFHLTEISPQLQKIQQQRLAGYSVRWFYDLNSALKHCNGPACIYSNELLDAFPCMQFIYHEDQWQVVGLSRNQEGSAVESCRPPETDDEIAALEFLEISSEVEKEGRRLEIQWSVRKWLHQWSAQIPKGIFLAIDYGDEHSVLQKRYPQGSLRCYFQHQALEGEECYRRVGRQDLTVDVNFTHLRRWMEELGWTMTVYQEQRDFLLEHIRRNWSASLPEERILMNEFGAGGAFKVACFELDPS
ncbi:MAG: SAM-dependent methyltransferase [Verrucomicrobiota bacterium]